MQNERAALEGAFGDLGPHSELGSALWIRGRERALRQMQMRAAVLERFGAPLEVQEVELDEPSAGEALVRLEACGVCHTDLYTASGADPSGYAPTVLGHEGAGVVEQVGPDTRLVQPGDHVVTLFSPQCGECIHCRQPGRTCASRSASSKSRLPPRWDDAAVP